MPHIVIVGGGIAGLATAYYLQQAAAQRQPPLTYTLIEDGPCWGGKIATSRQGDLLIEGGPDSFVTQKPEGLQLCRELGLGDRLLGLNRRPVYVLHHGRLHTIPAGFYLAVPSNFVAFATSPLFTPWGKLRVAMEPFIPRRRETGDESLASFLRRRVGSEILERVAGPMMGGIFVADPEHLSMQGAFPAFVEMEQQHGSLVRALRARMKARQKSGAAAGPPPSPFMTLKGGMVELTDALVRRLTGDLRLGTHVAALQPQAQGIDLTLSDGATLHADALVLAIPAFAAAELVRPHLPELADQLGTIRYLSTATLSLAFRRDQLGDAHHLDGTGFIIANKEAYRVMACTISSNKFNHRAPDDLLLLRFFLGGYANEHLVALPDDALLAAVREELAGILGIHADPVTHSLFRWPRGNPQYDVGHLDRVNRMEELAARLPGLHLTGSAYRGIGIPGCIANAHRTTQQLLAKLG